MVLQIFQTVLLFLLTICVSGKWVTLHYLVKVYEKYILACSSDINLPPSNQDTTLTTKSTHATKRYYQHCVCSSVAKKTGELTTFMMCVHIKIPNCRSSIHTFKLLLAYIYWTSPKSYTNLEHTGSLNAVKKPSSSSMAEQHRGH